MWTHACYMYVACVIISISRRWKGSSITERNGDIVWLIINHLRSEETSTELVEYIHVDTWQENLPLRTVKVYLGASLLGNGPSPCIPPTKISTWVLTQGDYGSNNNKYCGWQSTNYVGQNFKCTFFDCCLWMILRWSRRRAGVWLDMSVPSSNLSRSAKVSASKNTSSFDSGMVRYLQVIIICMLLLNL